MERLLVEERVRLRQAAAAAQTELADRMKYAIH